MIGRRRALVAALASVSLLAAAGCSGSEPDTVSPTQALGPSVLTVAVYGPAPVVTAYLKIASTFSAEHPGTSVNVIPYENADAAMTAVTKGLADGTAPDAFLAPQTALATLVADESIRPVDDLLSDREVDFGDAYQRYSLEAFSSERRQQCMPVDLSPMVVYYNTDLVDLTALTLPDETPVDATEGWDLEQFTAAARRASGRGVRGVYIAPTLEQVAPFLWSGGGDLVDDVRTPTTLKLGSGGSQSALIKLLGLLRNENLTFNAAQIADQPALSRFKTGSLAMILGFRDLTPELRDVKDLHFDVMPLPHLGGEVTVGEGSGLCLNAKAPNLDRAADFLAYAVSGTASTMLAQTGFVVPTNLDVLNSSAFLQPGSQPSHAGIFAAEARNIRPTPIVPAWPEVEKAAAPLIAGLFYDPAIDPIEERLTKIDSESVPIFTPGVAPTP